MILNQTHRRCWQYLSPQGMELVTLKMDLLGKFGKIERDDFVKILVSFSNENTKRKN